MEELVDCPFKLVRPQSELVVILAVWVAVGKSRITGSQWSQDVLQ